MRIYVDADGFQKALIECQMKCAFSERDFADDQRCL